MTGQHLGDRPAKCTARVAETHRCCHLGLRRKVSKLCRELDLFAFVLCEPVDEGDCPVSCPHGVRFWVREIPGFRAPGPEFWAAQL